MLMYDKNELLNAIKDLRVNLPIQFNPSQDTNGVFLQNSNKEF